MFHFVQVIFESNMLFDFCKAIMFNVFVYAKQASKFKFFDIGKQIDLLVDPYKTNVLYNNLKDDMLPKQISSQA